MKKYFSISLVDYASVNWLREDTYGARSFFQIISNALKSTLNYQIDKHGQIQLTFTSKLPLYVKEYSSLEESQKNIHIEVGLKSSFYIRYQLLIECDKETNQVTAIYDPHYGKNKDNSFKKVDVSSLYLSLKDILNRASIMKDKLFDSITYGFIKSSFLQSHFRDFLLCIPKELYKISDHNSAKKSLAQAQVLGIFKKQIYPDIYNLIINNYLPDTNTPEMNVACKINEEKRKFKEIITTKKCPII